MRIVILCLFCMSFVSAFGSSKIILTGSSTIAPLVLEMAKTFEKKHSVRIDVQTGGSSRGIADARKGLADIGMASRALKKTENDIQSHIIAWDGVGLLVNSANPVKNLSKQQFKDIFTGKIQNWKDVGGPIAAIVVVNRADGRSEVEMVAEYLGIKSADFKASMIAGENAHGIKSISTNINAITYISVGHALKEAEFGVPVKLLSLEGVEATAKTVADSKYPLARPLNLITKSKPSGLVESFINYARGEEVHLIVKNQSFVPLSN